MPSENTRINTLQTSGKVEKLQYAYRPLFTLWNFRESFKVLEKRRRNEEEVKVVESLENWKPATPLVCPS